MGKHTSIFYILFGATLKSDILKVAFYFVSYVWLLKFWCTVSFKFGYSGIPQNIKHVTSFLLINVYYFGYWRYHQRRMWKNPSLSVFFFHSEILPLPITNLKIIPHHSPLLHISLSLSLFRTIAKQRCFRWGLLCHALAVAWVAWVLWKHRVRRHINDYLQFK